jgi:hypothetical protein
VVSHHPVHTDQRAPTGCFARRPMASDTRVTEHPICPLLVILMEEAPDDLTPQSGSSFPSLQECLETDAVGLRTHGGGNSAATEAMLSSAVPEGWPRHGVASAITTRSPDRRTA